MYVSYSMTRFVVYIKNDASPLTIYDRATALQVLLIFNYIVICHYKYYSTVPVATRDALFRVTCYRACYIE